jgi:hypothetical protein
MSSRNERLLILSNNTDVRIKLEIANLKRAARPRESGVDNRDVELDDTIAEAHGRERSPFRALGRSGVHLRAKTRGRI